MIRKSCLILQGGVVVDDEAALRRHLVELVNRHVRDDRPSTAVPGLLLYRRTAPTALTDTVYEPSLSLVVQGRKQTVLGPKNLRYGDDRYLLTPVRVPVVSRVLEATPEVPFLGLMLRLDPITVTTVLAAGGLGRPPLHEPDEDPTGHLDGTLLHAVVRTVRLLDTPQDIPVLAPLAIHELVYRLTTSDRGHRLRWPDTRYTGAGARIAQAVSWLKANYAQPLYVPSLAAKLMMSTSSLHEHFRAATGMTPVQYQKALRLGEARRLMVVDLLDATTAAHTVGYTSPSQFSRDYRRVYGDSPLRDALRLRTATSLGAT